MQQNLQVTIPAKSEYSYSITLAKNQLNNLLEIIKPIGKFNKIVIISDETVAKIYSAELINLLNIEYPTFLITFPSGESNKSATTKALIEEKMFNLQCDRHTLCIALGGGVVGDLAGFTAATYMRGIKVIQIPTTLLSMIDSSVGGKTAINTSYGKNIIGAFWQPSAVVIDTQFLATLPPEHITNGFIEALKIFLTFDKTYVHNCLENLDKLPLLNDIFINDIIYKAITLKAHVVEIDETEQNLRMSLNFGHTVGHALEKLTNYTLLHGYAVGYGILLEAKIAQLLNLITNDEYDYITKIFSKLHITKAYFKQFDKQSIIKEMRGDKKNNNQTIKIVLINGIGTMKNIDNQVAFAVNEAIIEQAIDELTKE